MRVRIVRTVARLPAVPDAGAKPPRRRTASAGGVDGEAVEAENTSPRSWGFDVAEIQRSSVVGTRTALIGACALWVRYVDNRLHPTLPREGGLSRKRST